MNLAFIAKTPDNAIRESKRKTTTYYVHYFTSPICEMVYETKKRIQPIELSSTSISLFQPFDIARLIRVRHDDWRDEQPKNDIIWSHESRLDLGYGLQARNAPYSPHSLAPPTDDRACEMER